MREIHFLLLLVPIYVVYHVPMAWLFDLTPFRDVALFYFLIGLVTYGALWWGRDVFGLSAMGGPMAGEARVKTSAESGP